MKQKKLVRLLICVLAIMLVIGMGVAALATASGDINNDGQITVLDAQLIAEANAGLRQLTDDQKLAAAALTVRELIQQILV